MVIDQRLKDKIHSVIYTFETGKKLADYGALTVVHDGGDDHRLQISYGKLQIIEYGRLNELVKSYVDACGMYAERLRPYVGSIGRRPLATDTVFISFLKDAAKDEIMQNCQDILFDKYYWLPAVKWAQTHGFQLPLSMLVIFDSYIQSGGIMWEIRRRFGEYTPANDGNEKLWIQAYVHARRDWLAEYDNQYVRDSVYRMDCMLHAIDDDNWNLDKTIKTQGETIL